MNQPYRLLLMRAISVPNEKGLLMAA